MCGKNCGCGSECWRVGAADLDDVGFKRLLEVDEFASNAELDAVERCAHVLHVLHQTGHRVVVVAHSAHQVLSLVAQLSHRETLVRYTVAYHLHPTTPRNGKITSTAVIIVIILKLVIIIMMMMIMMMMTMMMMMMILIIIIAMPWLQS